MKQTMLLKMFVITTFIPFNFCFADDVPSNSLQVEYKKNSERQIQATSLLSLNTVYQIPTSTYSYLDDVFTSFYNKVTFSTSIADKTFISNSHYELVSVPLIAENEKGIQLEVFGNFSDPATQQLSNISKDQTLSNYYSHTQNLNIYESDFSIGAGFSFNTSEYSKVKVIISNSSMPGHGSSNALLGFETNF